MPARTDDGLFIAIHGQHSFCVIFDTQEQFLNGPESNRKNFGTGVTADQTNDIQSPYLASSTLDGVDDDRKMFRDLKPELANDRAQIISSIDEISLNGMVLIEAISKIPG